MPTGFFGEDADGKYLLADLTGEVDMWLEIDPDDPDGVVLRTTEADPNFPAESDVRDTVVYGYADEYTGTLYGADVPNPPTLSCEDQQDGGTVVATVTGADAGTTNEIYTSPFGQLGVMGWTLQGSVTDNGTLTFTLPKGLYVSKVVSRFTP